MTTFMPCQICGHDDWDVLAERVFPVTEKDSQDRMTQHIFKFIFEVWFPGKTELCVKNICCTRCGFICFFPRPSEQEMDILRTRNTDLQTGFCPQTDIAVSQQRSRYLYDYIRSMMDIRRVKKVMDFGGMDGNLMQAFIAEGKSCFLVDYCPYCIPNMTKLGNTVDDLKEDDVFDLIICSHVLEHVASPVRVLDRLSQHLSKDGMLFVEVPMEIWKRPPLLTIRNPITHLNFFLPNSLKQTFFAAGLTVEKCHFVEYFHTSSDWNPGIRCVGRWSPDASIASVVKSDASAYLKPSALSYVRFYLSNRRRLKKEILKRLKLQ